MGPVLLGTIQRIRFNHAQYLAEFLPISSVKICLMRVSDGLSRQTHFPDNVLPNHNASTRFRVDSRDGFKLLDQLRKRSRYLS